MGIVRLVASLVSWLALGLLKTNCSRASDSIRAGGFFLALRGCLKADFYALKERIEQTVLAERNAVTTAIDEVADKIDQTSELAALPSEQQARIRGHDAG